VLPFVICLGVCFVVALFGAQFGTGEWYMQLAKPSWTPPDAVFGPVWTILYAMMGVAAALTWRQVGFAVARKALLVFGIQLVLNAAWSWIFFGLHRSGTAFVDVVALWCSILATVILFWQIRPLAGVLLLPYLAWVSFASVLNFAVWRMNA
jgi:benzodiazapine receptor